MEELREILACAKETNQKVSVLGGGTNVLVSDRGVRGLVIHMRSFSGIEEKMKTTDCTWSVFREPPRLLALRSFLKRKLEPAVFLTGLPGDIGGGVVMNAGVDGSRVPREFCEMVDWVEVLRMDGRGPERIESSSLEWGYRYSRGWQPGVITKVGLSWSMEPNENIMGAMKEATRNRIVKQPINQPSCGSVFRNPKPHFAGQLIESLPA